MVIDAHSFIPCGMPSVYVLGPLYLFLTTLIVVPIMRWVALRAGFVDNPGGRKQHDMPVPPIGGFAIFLVYMSFLIFAGSIASSLFVALGLILVVGIIDDARGMNAKVKFVLHFLAAIILVVGGGAQIMTLGNVLGFGTLELGIMTIPFSVACVVYILNAVNMMDGVDGLAGGNSFIILAWFAVAALWAGRCADLIEILA
ncbi:MAG: MraY family glycosyltransferase, partial [Pseudomonadota bacterium]